MIHCQPSAFATRVIYGKKAMLGADDSAKLEASLIGVGFNSVLALVTWTTGFIGHSFAMIAHGIESLSVSIT